MRPLHAELGDVVALQKGTTRRCCLIVRGCGTMVLRGSALRTSFELIRKDLIGKNANMLSTQKVQRGLSTKSWPTIPSNRQHVIFGRTVGVTIHTVASKKRETVDVNIVNEVQHMARVLTVRNNYGYLKSGSISHGAEYSFTTVLRGCRPIPQYRMRFGYKEYTYIYIYP